MMSIPTILVPGIKGTTLVNINTLDFDTIWSGIQSKFETIYDLELQLNPSFEKEPKSIIERSDVEDLAYREALVVLEKEIKSTIYIFGYDWRQSCRENGKRLKKYVDYLKAKLKTDKFNFLTHSMGGILFSCYLKELNGKYDEIAGAVLTVCPFHGSVNALIALIIGEGGIKFPFFNSNDIFRKIARTFPSVYELAPIYRDAVVFDPTYKPNIPFDLYETSHWQSNIVDDMFMRRLSELKQFRIDNPAMLDLASLDKSVRKRMVIIAGRGEKTKKRVVVKKKTPDKTAENFFDFKQPDGDGDGTVPFESATIYKSSILTLEVESKWYDGATHGFFLNDGRVQTVIKRFFKNDIAHKEWWTDIARTVRKVK
ncbi:MAG: lipase/acyltransferase domain-containing protein [bacterium]